MAVEVVSSYAKIVGDIYFQRGGPQEDPGWGIKVDVERFKSKGILYRREMIYKVPGKMPEILGAIAEFVGAGTLGVVGALGMYSPGKEAKLVCLGPQEVEEETAPDERHLKQIFSPDGRKFWSYCFIKKEGTIPSKLLRAGPEAMLDPRNYDLGTGVGVDLNTFEDKEVFGASLRAVSLDKIIRRFKAERLESF